MEMEDVTIRGLSRKISALETDIIAMRRENNEFKLKLLNDGHGLEQRLISDSAKASKDINTIRESLDVKLSDSHNKLNKLIDEQIDSANRKLHYSLEQYNNQQSARDILMYDTIRSLGNRLDNTYIDIINNDDNITITYTDSKGKTEYGSILKVRADNKTLKQDSHGVIGLKQSYDKDAFVIENDVITPTKIRTIDGRYVSAEYIYNDLKNATYNIGTLTNKLERLQKQINTSNGYIASNNFKSALPSQEKLTNFVLECLSGSFKEITKEQIPVGTKIKNTFDNHIWVFNRTTFNGLTTYRWEDFGSDNICVASNNGVHGLVTGSDDKFEGHIDLRGIITINGLREEIESLIQNELQLKAQLQSYEEKFISLESRIRALEDK